jgi:hypothetical protein
MGREGQKRRARWRWMPGEPQGGRGQERREKYGGNWKTKPEKIYPIDRSRKWLLNNSPTDSSLQK